MLQAITYLPSIIAVFVISLIILSSGARKSYVRYFGLLNISILAWLIFQYLADISSGGTAGLYLLRLAVCFSMLMPLFFLLFCIDFSDTKIKRATQFTLVIPVVGMAMLSLTDQIIFEVEKIGTGLKIVDPGLGYTVLTVTILTYFIIAISLLHRAKRGADASRKSQINIILMATYLVVFSNVLTGYVLPQLNVADYACLAVGPSIVVLTVAIARAMAKHRLFDVRAFFARSLGYLVLVFVLSVLYGSVLFAVTKVIFNRFTIDENSKLIISTLLAVVLALTFQSLRTFVDGLTRRLFYRDSYDTQTVLDAVSGVIVGNVDPHKVQKGALTILSDALKPTFARFILLNSSGNFTEADGWGQKWDMHDPEALQGVLKRLGNKITIYDDIVDQSKKSKEVLKTEGINLVAPLVTKDENIGYLVIGSKKSGDIYSQKDTGLLNIATNELAVALQNAQRFEEIQAFNITLQEKITDATRELKRSNKKLIALDEAKDEFISMASHQLRTPLTSVKGYISMMLEEDLGKVNAAQEKALKEAFGSSQRMVYLIADFLNVSRIKTGKFMIEPKEVDLPEIVREELTQLREMASSRELTLEYDQPEVFPRVKLDDNKIRQVMMNMVDNAIYYTPTGGTIVIQLYSTGSEIYFKVVDSGIGVPKAEQHKLFTKFYRAGNARKARPDGTGLGLFMAQKIVAEQGGAIIFESEEGKGSTFGFRFPLDKIKI